MKNVRSPITASTLFLAVIACLLLAAAPRAFASAEDHIDEGLAASQGWVAQIDEGKYDESYDAASGEMHEKVPQDKWATVLKTIRMPWGAVVSRHQLSHVYRPNGFEGAEGEFLLVTYQTSFAKLTDGTEFVVLRWEDGKWRGAGYNAGPKPTAEEANQNQQYNSTTETHTEEHVKPEPQQ